MDIFERDKLPVVATVEQVCFMLERLHQRCIFHNPRPELFDRADCPRQDAEDIGRGDGTALR